MVFQGNTEMKCLRMKDQVAFQISKQALLSETGQEEHVDLRKAW